MMSAKKYNFLIYGLVVVCAPILISHFLNPKRLVIRNMSNSIYSKHAKPNFFILNTLPKKPSTIDLWQFRGNPQRTAYQHINFNPLKTRLEKISTKKINIGKHSASKASPSLSKSFIILAGDQGTVQILNRSDQKEHWSLKLTDSNEGIHSTPITYSDYCLIGDYSGKLYFLNLLTKKIIWIIDLGDAIGATPLWIDDFVYVNVETRKPNGYLVKINPWTAQIKWQSDYIGEQSHSSPALYQKNLYFGANNGIFYKMSSISGKVLWRYQTDGPIKSTPTVFKDSVIFSSWDGHIYSLNTVNGKLNWVYKISLGNQSSLAIDVKNNLGVINDHDGILFINIQNGKKIQKKIFTMDRSRIGSPVIVSYNNTNYVVSPCEQSSVCIINSQTYELVKHKLTQPLSNTVTLSENNLYLAPNQDSQLLSLTKIL